MSGTSEGETDPGIPEAGPGGDPLVAGETLIDFVPTSARPLAEVESFDRRAGGAPANVAVGLSRLGRRPPFWTRVGADPFGDFLAERLSEEGIPGQFVERDGEAATTLAFVSGAAAGPRFTFYRDGTADTRLQAGTVPDETLDETPWVHAGGVALADEPARSATLDLLERAADADCTVSFDPNVRPALWANDAELAAVCGWAVEVTDVLVATPGELRTLGYAGDDPEALARDALGGSVEEDEPDDGPHTVVLTLGADGALAVAGADSPWEPGIARHDGFPVDAVDDTGAGDAFTAGLIDAFDRLNRAGAADADEDRAATSLSLPDALAFANAVAAISTTERGAMTALPARDAVVALLES